MSADGPIVAGTIGSPHGLDGSFHVSDPAEHLLRDGSIVTVDGIAYAIGRRAGHPGRLILALIGIRDRDGALALRGRTLMVARDSAPALEEDEWWAEDLEGCRVCDGSTVVGVVERLTALPSCEVLEVAREGGGTVLLVPLVSDAVRSVDIEAQVIDIDLAFLGEP